MSLTAADVRRIVREELAKGLPAGTPIHLDWDAIKAGLREHFAALQTHESGLQVDQRQDGVDEGLVDSEGAVDEGDGELAGRGAVAGDEAEGLVAEAVHGEPPCGCGDDTVGGPDPGDPSGSGSGPDGGAS